MFLVCCTFLLLVGSVVYTYFIEQNRYIAPQSCHVFWCKNCNRFEPSDAEDSDVICSQCGQKITLAKF